MSNNNIYEIDHDEQDDDDDNDPAPIAAEVSPSKGASLTPDGSLAIV